MYSRSQAGRQVQLWTPALMVNSKVWYDASDLGTLTITGGGSSGGISNMLDKSGNNKHMAQGSATDQPIAGTRTLNGLNTLDFDGINDTMLHGSSIADTTFEVHMVIDSDSTNQQVITVGSPDNFSQFSIDNINNLNLYSAVSLGSGALPHNLNTPTIAGYLVNGFGSQIYTNGNIRSTGNAGNGNWGNTAWIGSDTGFQKYFNGGFAELVCFAGNDGNQRQKIEGYFAWKWGQQALLPVGHPYKLRPPTVND